MLNAVPSMLFLNPIGTMLVLHLPELTLLVLSSVDVPCVVCRRLPVQSLPQSVQQELLVELAVQAVEVAEVEHQKVQIHLCRRTLVVQSHVRVEYLYVQLPVQMMLVHVVDEFLLVAHDSCRISPRKASEVQSARGKQTCFFSANLCRSL